MGDTAPRKQPLDAQETWEEAGAESEQEAQAEPDPPPAGDPTKKQGPRSKFHGNEERR